MNMTSEEKRIIVQATRLEMVLAISVCEDEPIIGITQCDSLLKHFQDEI